MADVYTLGTGADVLKEADVILAVDGVAIDAHGRYDHPVFRKLVYRHLIATKKVGDPVRFDLWRGGEKISVTAKAASIKASDMLVPYYEFDRRPEYVVLGGFVLQKLTRPYFLAWGSSWRGRVAPLLTRYWRNEAFKPRPERRDIVFLSYVIPVPANIGYQDLRQLVVKTINGKRITCMEDIAQARRLNPDSPFDVIEFENANPTVVIPRAEEARTAMAVRLRYGVRELEHVEGGK